MPDPQPNQSVNKIIVVVHGLGDQTRSETAQKVILRFCRYHDKPMGVPLGQIRTLSNPGNKSAPTTAPANQCLLNNEEKILKPFRMSELGYAPPLSDLVFVWHRYIRHSTELAFSKWKPLYASETGTKNSK